MELLTKTKTQMKNKIFTITSRIMFLTGLLLTTASALMVGAGNEYPVEVETPQIDPVLSEKTISEEPCDEQIAGLDTVSCGEEEYTTVKATAFSSVECKTTWCRANAGLPRGQKVALNAKFGHATSVYIPEFDKTYEVIGTTDYKTDLDIWFGDDQESALEFGTRDLPIKILK